MNRDSLLFLLAILIVRAFFYHLPFRRSIAAYAIASLVEIGMLFLLFKPDTTAALAVSGLIILMSLLLWVFETRVVRSIARHSAGDVSPALLLGLILQIVVIVIVFTSPHTPHLRQFLHVGGGIPVSRVLLALVGGLLVTFESDHLFGRSIATPLRLLVYLFWLYGALLPAALIIVSAMAVAMFLSRENRLREVNLQILSATLAVLLSATIRALLHRLPIVTNL